MTRQSPPTRFALGLLVIAAVIGAGGCGVYSTTSGRVDESMQRVAVEYLDNRTAEADLGIQVAELIILSIQEDNTLEVVSTQVADTVIDGSVTGYRLRRMAVSPELQVEEYQVQMVVELTMRMRSTGEAVFEKRRFTGTGNYYLDDPNGSDETTAREEAIEEIVRDVLALVVEDW